MTMQEAASANLVSPQTASMRKMTMQRTTQELKTSMNLPASGQVFGLKGNGWQADGCILHIRVALNTCRLFKVLRS
jgi:hypothetical protein